ncbi:MAG: hypothetical protein QJR03_10025 [Sphaerobacter sp.]|nr:hypothetical protein [Sphaerobacter sp.]
MGSPYDVVIAGQGYMVRAGSYERRQAAPDAGQTGRVRLFDFYGGAGRAAQLERDRFWRGVGAWPALDSQGIQAGPRRQDRVETLTTPFDPAARTFSFVHAGTTYVVNGTGLYRVTTSGGAYAGLQLVRALAAPCLGVAVTRSHAAFVHGLASRPTIYDLTTGAYTTSAVADHATRIAPARDGAVLLNYANIANGPDLQLWEPWQDLRSHSPFPLDREVLAMTPFAGEVWVVTRGAIWRVEAAPAGIDAAVATTAPQTGFPDDLAWLLGHNGVLYAWLGKEVHRYDTADDTFVPIGLRGRATHGACGIGRWLVVAIEDEHTGLTELWAWDGRGWWLLDASIGAADQFRQPVNIAGPAADADLLAARGTAANQTAIWQLVPRAGLPGLRDTATLVTSLLDAGMRDVEKVWRLVGVELAWPDPRGSATPVTVTLDYSTDGGAGWSPAATATVRGDQGRTHALAGRLPAAARSRWLQVRVTLSGIVDWCPVIVGVWAEHTAVDPETRRRRWSFAVQCKDEIVRRDGGVDRGDARALAAALWDAWAAGGVVTFRDLDYDRIGIEYTARIVAIREEVAKPHDAGRWGDGWVALTLEEV